MEVRLCTEHMLPMLVGPEWWPHEVGKLRQRDSKRHLKSSPRPCVAFMLSPAKLTTTHLPTWEVLVVLLRPGGSRRPQQGLRHSLRICLVHL